MDEKIKNTRNKKAYAKNLCLAYLKSKNSTVGPITAL